MSRLRLFLDCDGVLADFDAGARALLGSDPDDFVAAHGKGEFWRRLARAPGFYAGLPKMADADELFAAVRHLEPTILTGLPIGRWAAPQKVAWAAEHFPGVPTITCMARDKYRHMEGRPGVLVDDSERHRAAWEDAGGVFVHHRGARASVAQLAEIYPDVAAPA